MTDRLRDLLSSGYVLGEEKQMASSWTAVRCWVGIADGPSVRVLAEGTDWDEALVRLAEAERRAKQTRRRSGGG